MKDLQEILGILRSWAHDRGFCLEEASMIPEELRSPFSEFVGISAREKKVWFRPGRRDEFYAGALIHELGHLTHDFDAVLTWETEYSDEGVFLEEWCAEMRVGGFWLSAGMEWGVAPLHVRLQVLQKALQAHLRKQKRRCTSLGNPRDVVAALLRLD